MTTNELTRYLYNVYRLEKQKYEVTYAFNRIKSEIDKAKYMIEENANVEYQQPQKNQSIVLDIVIYIMLALVGAYWIAWIGFMIDILSQKAFGIGEIIDKVLSILLSFVWPGVLLFMEVSFKEWQTMWSFKLLVLGFLICVSIAVVSLIRDRRDTKIRNLHITRENEEIKLNSQQAILSNQKYINNVLIPEREKLRLIYKRTDVLLTNLYSVNIIGEKYRNLVAVSSFYEYLKYERCSSLTGVHGAYNKFEDEIYKQRILAKLDEVIRKLDEIKANQFMLYNAIKDSQQQTKNLFDDLHHQMSINNNNQQAISESLDRLDYNAGCIRTNLDIERYWREIRR